MSHRSPYLSAGKKKKQTTKNPNPQTKTPKLNTKPITNLDPFKNAILGMFGFQD